MRPWDGAEEVESPEMKLGMELWDGAPEIRPWDGAEEVESPEIRPWDGAMG